MSSRPPIPPEQCPDPGSHGNPFRYCPYCTWTEEPAPQRVPIPMRPRPPGDIAAAAAYGAFRISTQDRLGELPSWDALAPEARADWRAVADAVLMIAELRGQDGGTGA